MQKEAWLFILPLQEKDLAGRGGRLGETKEMIKIKMCSMSTNVFLVPCVSYLLGSKGNMHQLPTGLPDVFTVFRLGDPRKL